MANEESEKLNQAVGDAIRGDLSDDAFDRQLDLIRIGVSSPPNGGGAARRMTLDGWDIHKVAAAELNDLRRYSFSDEISQIWIENAQHIIADA